MERVDKRISEVLDMLVYLASDNTIPTPIREGLVGVVEAQLDAANKLKKLMLRGVVDG